MFLRDERPLFASAFAFVAAAFRAFRVPAICAGKAGKDFALAFAVFCAPTIHAARAGESVSE
jgi:hypothetical protein